MAIGDEFWNSLNEDEKAQIASSFGMTGPTPFDYGFEDDFGAEPLPGGFDFSYGGGFNGMGDPGMGAIQPSVDYFTTKGKIDPTSRTEEAGRVNLLQDYGSLSVDNILTGYAGGGAYDVGAFTPTYDYGEPINLKGRRKAESLAESGGWQGFVTDLILEGKSPAEAEAMLYQTIEAPDDETLTDEERLLKQGLAESMKPLMAADTGAPASVQGRSSGRSAATTDPYDTAPIREFTTRVWSDLMDDPEFKHYDEATGLYYDKTPEEAMVKTPQMMAYDKFGIPYPTATYEDPKYMEEFTAMAAGGAGPEERETMYGDWQGQQDARMKQAAAARQSEVASGGAASALEKAFAESQKDQRPMTEWDAILDAARSGGDQQGARDKFNQTYGPNRRGQGPLAPGSQGGGFDFLGQGGEPPMISGPGPYSGINRAGDRALLGDKSLRTPWGFAAARPNRGRPTVKRTKQEDVDKQRGRARTATTNRSRQANQVYRETYNDPRLAAVEALGRAYALAQSGQTPFRDAMQVRNANSRRMLSGG